MNKQSLLERLQSAAMLYERQDYPQAELLFKDILKTIPKQEDAIHFLGLIAYQQENYPLAIEKLLSASKISPKQAHFQCNLGVAYFKNKEVSKAYRCLKKAVQLNPELPEFHFHLGNFYYEQNKYLEAIDCFKTTLKLQDTHTDALNNLGACYFQTHHYDQAEACFNKSLQVSPQQANVYHNLALVYKGQYLFQEAIEASKKCLEIDENFNDAYCNLGLLFVKMGLLFKGLSCYNEGIKRAPNAELYTNISCIYSYLCAFDASYTATEKALALDPYSPERLSNKLMTQCSDEVLSPEDLYLSHRSWAKTLHQVEALPKAKKYQHSRLRIGYVSSDFYQHVVSYFFEPILKYHNKEIVDTYCYASVSNPDATTERLKTLSYKWRDVSFMTHLEAAQLIRKDEIDILIDLSGHTSGNRLPIFAYEPAPIQITYLGYPATTGMEAMHYRLTDSIADPEINKTWHSEKLLYLPDGFLAYEPPHPFPAIEKSSAEITFVSFNHMRKVNSAVIQTWSAILKALPQAKLLLKSVFFNDMKVRSYYKQQFKEQAKQVEFLRYAMSQEEHLQLYNRATLALDTFPYNGTTTTFEALAMDTPVLTLCGQSHAQRVGTSILSRLKLNDWIAHTHDEYIQKAIALSTKATEYKVQKRLQQSPLSQSRALTKQLETILLNLR